MEEKAQDVSDRISKLTAAVKDKLAPAVPLKRPAMTQRVASAIKTAESAFQRGLDKLEAFVRPSSSLTAAAPLSEV
jgi:hypothetical protein